MKPKLLLLAGAALAGLLAYPALGQQALDAPDPAALGAKKDTMVLTNIQIRNFQDESLGRVRDLGVDLINGRIIVVLVASDTFLGMGGKTTAVPPRALIADPDAHCYRLNSSAAHFAAAPAVDLPDWNDATHGKRFAAAYRYFGQEPYFLEEGGVPGTTPAGHPKVALGFVERSSKIVDMPVGNHQNVQFGKVFSLTLDIQTARVQNVIVSPGGNFSNMMSVVPAMALSFNDKRDALVLNDTKAQLDDEPRYVLTGNTLGLPNVTEEESYAGPHTDVALAQGTSYRDVDRTVQINQGIRAAKINAADVEVGTLNGRVTLRGQVATEDDRRRIGEIAIAATRLEVVDNQITVGSAAPAVKPVTVN